MFTLEVSPEPTGNIMQIAKQDAHKRFRQKTLSLCRCACMCVQALTHKQVQILLSCVWAPSFCGARLWDTRWKCDLWTPSSSSLSPLICLPQAEETWEEASWQTAKDWSRLCREEVTCRASVTFKEVFWQLWYDLSLWHTVSSLSHQIGYPLNIGSTKTTIKLQWW